MILRKFVSEIKRIIKKIIIIPFINIFIRKIDNNKIVFDNFVGKGFGDNPKYIALELIKQNVNCKMVWIVTDLETEMPKQIKKVPCGSIQSFYELATAKVWIDNVRISKKVKKKKNQFYIQTWHGGMGFKRAEKEIEEKLSREYVKDAKNDGKITDLTISDSDIFTEFLKTSFWYNGPILQKGFPRNDILFEKPKEIIEKVYNYFNIPNNKKIALYVPTFRMNNDIEVYKFNYEKCLETLHKRFNEDFVLLIRLHPNVSNLEINIEWNNNVIDATKYPDVQELLVSTEIGITDYSNVMFDLSIMNTPVFLLCKDFDYFTKNERNLRFQISDLFFNYSLTEEGLYENILKFDYNKYKEESNKFFETNNYVRNSDSAKHIVEIIKKQLKSEV